MRSGTIEIVYDGTVLDLLGEGELFGHASMLSGLPTGFEARAAEDVTCYRIDAEVAREPAGGSGRPAVRRALAARATRAGRAQPTSTRATPRIEPVGALLRGPPVVCASADADPRRGRAA